MNDIFEFIDLTLLEKKPELDKEVILEIEPLAPISMVSDLPGSYYKTLKSPSKKMLCGLFENIMGWHIDAADRKELIKDLKKIRKKQGLEFLEEGGSSFTPLIMEYFEIKLALYPQPMHYDDYWSKAYRRADAIVHPKGTFNISYDLIPQKRELPRNEKKPRQVDEKSLENFFKEHKDSYPLYYSSPTGREHIFFKGKYQIKLLMDRVLMTLINDNVIYFNLGFLGTNEGWVDIKFREI